MLHKRKKEKKSKKGKGGKREGKHGAKSVINSGKDVCALWGGDTDERRRGRKNHRPGALRWCDFK